MRIVNALGAGTVWDYMDAPLYKISILASTIDRIREDNN